MKQWKIELVVPRSRGYVELLTPSELHGEMTLTLAEFDELVVMVREVEALLETEEDEKRFVVEIE